MLKVNTTSKFVVHDITTNKVVNPPVVQASQGTTTTTTAQKGKFFQKLWEPIPTAAGKSDSNKPLPVHVIETVREALEKLDSSALERILSKSTQDIEKLENGNTPLLFAAECGYYEGIQILLRYKANMFALQHKTLRTVLHLAVIGGDIQTIQLVLEINESLINQQDSDGNTALHLSINLRCANNRVKAFGNRILADCAQNVLFFYPDFTIMNHDGETPLYFAAKHQAWNIFLLLLNNGAPLNLYHPKGAAVDDSLFVLAFRDHHVSSLQYLLDHGANWHDIDRKTGCTILNMVCNTIKEKNLIDTVMKPVASNDTSIDSSIAYLQPFFEKLQKSSWLLVHYAAKHGVKEILETVLEVTDDRVANAQDEHGNTAIHVAIEAHHLPCVQTILFFLPNLTIMNHSGETALYFAAKHHAWDAFHLLLQNGAVLTVQHSNKAVDSLLQMAVRDVQVEAIRLLTEKGADVNELDKQTGLPLWFQICHQIKQASLTTLISNCKMTMNFESEMNRKSPLYKAMIIHVQDIKEIFIHCVRQCQECVSFITILQSTIAKDAEIVTVVCERLRNVVESSIAHQQRTKKIIGGYESLVNVLKNHPQNERIIGNVCRILSLMFPVKD